MKLTGKEKPFNLLRWFSLLSFFFITLISIFSTLLLSRFLTNNMLQRDAVVTMEFVQTIVQAENTTAYFETEDRGKDKAAFEGFFNRIAVMPEVVRTNIYAKDGMVIWSDNEFFIGHRFMPNPELIRALAGKLAIASGVSGKPKKGEHVFDKEVPFFVEIYVPVWNEAKDKVIGSVEVYKVPIALFNAIKKGTRLVWMSAILGGLFLYASLFWIVRRAASVIHRQQERLIESETMSVVGQMASTVAHGIRNPLASIRSSAEVALEQNDLLFFRQASEDIILVTDRLGIWVRELLAYAKPHHDGFKSVQINEIIRSALGAFERETEKHEIKLNLCLKEPLSKINGDETLLRYALVSLIANAVEAMPKGGELTVTSHVIKNRSHIEITMKDTGHGIPKEQIDKVFKPFFTTKPQGMGFGLSLAKQIVERHGGIIHLESEKDLGTTVRLQFPTSR